MSETKHYLSYYNDDYSTIRIETPSGEVLCILDDERVVDIIIDELNGLKDENKELKDGYLKLQKMNDNLYEENQRDKQLIDELYLFRLMYNALLFNNWYENGEVEVYKSKRHHDGSIPFEDDSDDWFIVVAILPTGKQITNHYPMKYWYYFDISSYGRVKDEFDGHDSSDVLERLVEMIEYG